MHAKLKYFDDFESWHKLARYEIQPVKYLISGSVVLLLVIAWVLTNPLFQLHDRMVGRNREQGKTESRN